MVLTAYSELSPATNSSCHRRRRIKVLPNPVGLAHLRRLDTSNGCQDHTALPSASAPFVHTPVEGSRAFAQSKARPAFTSRDDAAASTASRPAFVTIASRPSEERDGRNKEMIWVRWKRGIFFARGLDRNLVICPTGRFGALHHNHRHSGMRRAATRPGISILPAGVSDSARLRNERLPGLTCSTFALAELNPESSKNPPPRASPRGFRSAA